MKRPSRFLVNPCPPANPPGIFRTILGLLLLAVPSVVQAQFTYTSANGRVTITGYSGTSHAVTIPDTIDNQPVTTIGKRAFMNLTAVDSVTIPSSVTSIEQSAFAGSGLTTVTIPDSVTNLPAGQYPFYPLETGPAGVFQYCTNLASVTLGLGITNIGGATFAMCRSLTNISIGNSVTNIGTGAFYACLSLTNVTIPGNVTSIADYAFVNCAGLTNLAIANGVGKIGSGAFSYCTNLTGVTIPASVTSIGSGAFGDCKRLIAIDVDPQNSVYSSVNGVLFSRNQTTLREFPDGVSGSYTIPGGVTAIAASAFEDCTGLTGIIIPGSVTSIGANAFFNTRVTNVTIPAGITNIGGGAFSDCYRLTNVFIPAGVTNIGTAAFSYCTSLTSVTIPGNFNGFVFGALFYGSTNLTTATVADEVSSIGLNAFQYGAYLTTIKIPASVTAIDDYAFEYCTNLTSVYFTGDAPAADSTAFTYDGNATVYYFPGTAGWASTFAGRPAVLWNPLIQAGGSSFGVQNNQFGFNIAGTSNLTVVVAASPTLSAPLWTPLQTISLTNGSYYFNEPFQSDRPSRFYRLGPP